MTAFDPQLDIPQELTGVGGPVPVTEFACSAVEPGIDRFGRVSDAKDFPGEVPGAVVPNGGATLPATIAALNDAGIRVVGLFPSGARSGGLAGPS